MLWVALHFPPLPPGTLETFAGWACQFTPRVSLEPPRALLAEVAGSLRRFGGAPALAGRLRSGLAALGQEASIAMAPTARAALWIARGGGRRLEELPIEAMGFDLQLLKGIGISTLGEVLRLPREGLAKRCGPALLEALDQALGLRPEPRQFFAPPARFEARVELPAEAAHAEALLFPACRLLAQLAGLLEARQEGVRSVDCSLFYEKDSFLKIPILFSSLTRDAKRMGDLLREKLARTLLAQPVEALAVTAGNFEPLAGRSGGLFGDAAAEAEDWTRLLERLRSRLGPEAVHGITPVPDHRPEYAWRRVEPGDWEPREYRVPGPRPAWLVAPRRLPEGAPALLDGPERIECGWWDGDDARRDYFIARLGESALAWVYREDGEWWVHGFFA